MKEHINLLGLKAKDKVTGYEGVITSISFELYGCVQAIVTPSVDKDGDVASGRWFDIPRLKILSKTPVMVVPDFENERILSGRKGSDHNNPSK